MGISGGIGMLSAGFLGGPGIGYTQDYHASKQLQATAPAAYERVKSEEKNSFLVFPAIQGLDGQKVDVIGDKGQQLKEDLAKKPDDKSLQTLSAWAAANAAQVDADQKPVNDAVIHGGRRALVVTALLPVTMAVCYLLLVFYFASRGGYKAVHLDASGREVETSHKPGADEAINEAPPSQA